METKASFRLAVSSAVSVATNEETFIMADKTNQLVNWFVLSAMFTNQLVNWFVVSGLGMM